MKLSEKIINANIKDKKYSFETGYSIVLIIFGLIINIIILNWLNNLVLVLIFKISYSVKKWPVKNCSIIRRNCAIELFVKIAIQVIL